MTEVLITVGLLLAHAAAISLLILYERRQPAATLAWLLALLLLPGIGLILYALIGTTGYRRTIRRSEAAARRIDEVCRQFEVERKLQPAAGERGREPRSEGLLRLGAAVSSTGPSPANRVGLLVDGAATYRAMLLAIDGARDHVHVEFYIIQPDETGQRLRKHLVRAAERGVAVRVLYDAVGSSRLPGSFWNPLIEAGGHAAAFRPLLRILARLRRRDRVDFRNHRKILVVDGAVGFTGGINIGREYLGLNPDIGNWRDTHVQLEGPSVLSLQSTFAADWVYATGDEFDDARYFPEPQRFPGGAMVQVVDSGPDTRWAPIEAMYAYAIAAARHRVWITNPYFVPSPTIENALVTAALRGVDVRLLVPLRSDSFVVQMAARSYFPNLLEAGARVFRYEHGFVHAKTMVVDDWVATVGSANMDMRSFQLNFELNPFVLDQALVRGLATEFVDDLRRSSELRDEDIAGQTLLARFVTGVARLLSPLL